MKKKSTAQTVRDNALCSIAESGRSIREISLESGHDQRWLWEKLHPRDKNAGMNSSVIDELARILGVSPVDLVNPTI